MPIWHESLPRLFTEHTSMGILRDVYRIAIIYINNHYKVFNLGCYNYNIKEFVTYSKWCYKLFCACNINDFRHCPSGNRIPGFEGVVTIAGYDPYTGFAG